jgi:hypothetical protein
VDYHFSTIKSVAETGIEYIGENGQTQFIDFRLCNAHWLDSVFQRREIHRHDPHYVGYRAIAQDGVSYITFLTQPKIRFIFDNGSQAYEILLNPMRRMKPRWLTYDIT